MGRSINSFSGWTSPDSAVGPRVLLPEQKLFVAVLAQAVNDAFKKFSVRTRRDGSKQLRSYETVQRLDRDAARNFFMRNGEDLQIICEIAGRNSKYVHEKIRKQILRENGWNMDTTVRKTYRQRVERKRRRKYKIET